MTQEKWSSGFPIRSETDWSVHNRILKFLFMAKCEPCHENTGFLPIFAAIVKLISTFAFATPIVQSLFFLNPNFQAFSLFLLLLYRLVCVRPGRKPQRSVFSRRGLCANKFHLRQFWTCKLQSILFFLIGFCTKDKK